MTFYNLEDKAGFSSAIFEVDGIEASKETLAEAVKNGCEKAFNGTVTLEVQDTSNEGLSE